MKLLHEIGRENPTDCKSFFNFTAMTEQFKQALLNTLRTTDRDLTSPNNYPVLQLMIPWVKEQFGNNVLDLKEADVRLKTQSIDWNMLQELTGLPRLDFFLAVPQYTGSERCTIQPHLYDRIFNRIYTDESGKQLEEKNAIESRKLIGVKWNAGYPLPTIGSVIANNFKQNKCMLSYKNIADLIEQYYVPGGSFAECLELIDA